MNAPDSENARLPIQLPGILFLYVFSFFCGGSQVSAKVAGQIAVFDPAAVSSQPKWLKLLHYKNSASTPESDVLNSGFFLTPQGRIDPRAEARALFQQIILKTTEPPGDESAICRFP
ncbi:MAG: hypothetical protein EBX52_11055, partial [Proteobacteria bacterium]|nr:hypothetical protein [Pseudomonadota bacterium]